MEHLDVLYQKLLLMSQQWNTDHYGSFPVKIHPVERKLHYIVMKTDAEINNMKPIKSHNPFINTLYDHGVLQQLTSCWEVYKL